MKDELSLKSAFNSATELEFGTGISNFDARQIVANNGTAGIHDKQDEEAEQARRLALAHLSLDYNNMAVAASAEKWQAMLVNLGGRNASLGQVETAVQDINRDFDETVKEAQRCGRMRGMSRRDIDRVRSDMVEVDAELAAVRSGESSAEAAVQRIEAINPQAAELVAWQLEGRPAAPSAEMEMRQQPSPAAAPASAPSMMA